ncbi:hypothetical protein CFE70_007943 [Pyrenophora teres f. teres 0-1]|uniref:Uncharacterized protein n=1 Tax=Pyrenophora teres f. teres (strain 0-1) TaxID=861557 RepID=E3RQ31_PYRTT|nr:hypothetical protein PTT_10792 [Pyrenophora teres f. teres 0-1]KAE8829826.1 hypothetical protein HRS9139_06450 [Pyrenophora teres f. teres]KAE8859936.1 hypothetical protein PTNB29_07167 [Pyrenophora teres f. teres]
MSLPWVAFDSIASLDGDCANGAEPDIAGIGVVLSFLIASFMTTSASILAMLLDQAFDSKGHFNLRAPLTYFREHFVENQWKKHYAWRPFLDPLIIGFGDQQLVAQATFRVQSAHFVLILYICALSSSSHLAALITLRKYFRKYKFIAKVRIGLVVLFAVFLLASMLATIIMPPVLITDDKGKEMGPGSHFQKFVFLALLLLIFIGVSTALVCILHDPDDRRRRDSPASLPSSSSRRYLIRYLIHRVMDPEKAENGISRLYLYPARLGWRLVCLLFLTPSVAFVVQNLLANVSAVLVLTQKFVKPEDQGKFCGLQGDEENVWGFGQMLSVVMLLLPVLMAAQTYLEARHEIFES